MSHSYNYANERPAEYILRNIMRFITTWTNLRYQTVSPLNMADKYFEEHHEENREPLWQVCLCFMLYNQTITIFI